MRTYKTEAIVLKRLNIGEADKLVTVFTKRSGKITIKASGIRRITSRRCAHLEPFNLSSITLYKGRGMPVVTEAQVLEDFSEIKENLIKVGFAYHLCELIDGLCPENQENMQVFSLLRETLDRLSKEEDFVSLIHEFEIQLLTLLGFYHPTRFSKDFNTSLFIENILERRLKSRNLFQKLQ